ncbi:MAG: DNA-directed RNA polymerase subunit K [Candidatus Thorarchaeota archaeon]|jgi:DNA-directed RNA polymerase I, II, and III subunit RPABC2/DNA-directed RNA polymerase subunit K|nr:DNA-directed RNA polymerase subunit K [Candidatus Thorarchaeota archaeon]
MSKGPEPEKTDETETQEPIKPAVILVNIPGIGPKTAEKMVEAGFDSLEKISKSKAEDLASAVPGISVKKAETYITGSKALAEAIASGAVDITGKAKKAKRKKAAEPDPDKHDLPPAEQIVRAEKRKSLETGLDRERKKMGIPFGPKWLTRFEKARIIGARALQISMGAPILVDTKTAPSGLFALAEHELKAGNLPMTLRRSLPTGEYADIPLRTLLKNTKLD